MSTGSHNIMSGLVKASWICLRVFGSGAWIFFGSGLRVLDIRPFFDLEIFGSWV